MSRRRGRPTDIALADLLERLLRRRVMSVTQATEAVRRTGYRTTTRSLYRAVSFSLAMTPRLFRRVARGWYTSATHPARRERRRQLRPPGTGRLGPGSIVSVLLRAAADGVITIADGVAAVRRARRRRTATSRSVYKRSLGTSARAGGSGGWRAGCTALTTAPGAELAEWEGTRGVQRSSVR